MQQVMRGWIAGLAGVVLAALPAGSAAVAQDPGYCVQLEARLVHLERSRSGSSADITRRDSAILTLRKQLDAARRQAAQAGCGAQQGFLFFRPPRPPHCGDHDAIIARLEANVRALEAQRSAAPLQVVSGDRERAQLLAALGEHNCGPQYARYAPRPGSGGLFGFFNRDYGRDPYAEEPGIDDRYGTFRTICVRSCDGYFWPISFSTVSTHFGNDEQICRASCPGADVALYIHRNPGEEADDAVSLSGEPLRAHPNAFRHRREYVQDCTCRTATRTTALSERVIVDITARNGAVMRSDAAGSTAARAETGAIALPGTPLPRRPPGAVPPPVGSIATITGFEDYDSTSAPDVAQGERQVRNVGPGFTMYRRVVE